MVRRLGGTREEGVTIWRLSKMEWSGLLLWRGGVLQDRVMSLGIERMVGAATVACIAYAHATVGGGRCRHAGTCAAWRAAGEIGVRRCVL